MPNTPKKGNWTTAERLALAKSMGGPQLEAYKAYIDFRNECETYGRNPDGTFYLHASIPGSLHKRSWLAIPTQAEAKRLRVESIIGLMVHAMGIKLEDLQAACLPVDYQVALRCMLREAGKLDKAKPSWSKRERERAGDRIRQRTAAKVAARQAAEQAASDEARRARIAAPVPVHPSVRRATLKLIARLRLRYPQARESTIRTLAILDGGGLL